MIQLRPVVFADNVLIRQVFAAVLPLYQELMPGTFEANLANLDILSARGLDFNATGLTGFVVVHKGQDCGFCGVGPLNARQAYLGALHLLPAYQRQGVGSLALTALERHYARLGFQEMLMLVHARADWAQAFYRRLAYREIAHAPHAILAYAGPALEPMLQAELVLWAKVLPAHPI